MPKCKFCGCKIEWAKSRANMWVPIESEDVDYGDLDEGQSLITPSGLICNADDKQHDRNFSGTLIHKCLRNNTDGL